MYKHIIYIFISFIINYFIYNPTRILFVPFQNINGIADCYDMCYYKHSFCIEFYSKSNGLEYSCGKGEKLNFTDKLNQSQFARPGDICICLQDPTLKNIDPFIFDYK